MQLTYGHNILKSDNLFITGEVKLNITRTHKYSFVNNEANWEESYTVNEQEAYEMLALADPKFNWEASDPKNEFEMRNRLSALLTHGDMTREEDEWQTVVTLLPGSSFHYGYSHGTEEGYNSFSIEADWNDEDGWEIEESNGGRDCDGRTESTSTYIQKVNGERFSGKTQVYDEFAQMAGY